MIKQYDTESALPEQKGQVDHNYLGKVLKEIQEQPPWRRVADREMDYLDSNQLDSEILQQMKDVGIPPSIENMCSVVHGDICGMEEKNRADFKVEPDGENSDGEDDEVAKAIGYKLHKAERTSGADKACGDAYKTQSWVGIGWVEVSRDNDPFKPDIRCKTVHRNEIWWDMLAKEPDISDARWLLRRRWTDVEVAMMMFPGKKDIIENAGVTNWVGVDSASLTVDESGGSTNLAQSFEIERGWSIEEQEWRIPESGRVCLFELYTKEWEEVFILRMKGGRVVELDEENPNHQVAIALGADVEKAKISRIYKHFFLGPHLLQSEPIEFQRFPYVPFFGSLEDRTRIPYCIGRKLMYLQDEINARVSKMQWLLSSSWTVRTKGAVLMTDELFRQVCAMPNADIILDQTHMMLKGATFERHSNETLEEQQYKRLLDVREIFKTIGGVSDAMSGDAQADNDSALSQMVEQSKQGLAALNGSFDYSRMIVGDLITTIIVNDIGNKENTVNIKGTTLREEQAIPLNTPVVHEETGYKYLTNDVQRTKLKVSLEEVPSTSSYKKQEIASMGELGKSLPEEYRVVMAPYMLELSSVSNKEEIIKEILAIRQNTMLSEEQVDERIKEAIEQEKVKWMVEQKDRELDLKEEKQKVDNEKVVSETVNNAIESIYSGVQAALQINSAPGIAGTADQILKSANFVDHDLAPIVAEGPITAPPEVTQNTSPMYPPRVQEQDVDAQELPLLDAPDSAVTGAGNGIEAAGVQI